MQKLFNMLRVLTLLPSLILFGGFRPLPAQAAAKAGPTGITVSPAFQQVTIQANETEHPVSFTITNDKNIAQTLSLSTADFNTLSESGGLVFVGTNPTALQKKYGLAKWLSLPQTQITIAPGQTVTIKADVLDLASMPAGGHYGALMLAVQNPGAATTSNNIAVHPIASSLLFVTKLGGDTHKLGLAGVTVNRKFLSLPDEVILRFHNDGNTHLIPRGIVTVVDSRGKVVSKGIINDDSGIILPETLRRYYVPMQQIASSALPGQYKLRVDFRFDGISQFRSYQTSFWIIPWYVILIILVLVGLLIYTARAMIKRRSKVAQK